MTPSVDGIGDRDELSGRADGQRPEEQRVHHAEERGVGADSERERDDGDRGQALVTDQRAHAVEQILAKLGAERQAPARLERAVVRVACPPIDGRHALAPRSRKLPAERVPIGDVLLGAPARLGVRRAGLPRLAIRVLELPREVLDDLRLAALAERPDPQAVADVLASNQA